MQIPKSYLIRDGLEERAASAAGTSQNETHLSGLEDAIEPREKVLWLGRKTLGAHHNLDNRPECKLFDRIGECPAIANII
jgi:hypothetical protein